MKLLNFLLIGFFVSACSNIYLDFNEEFFSYTNIKNIACLYEQPSKINHSYEPISFPLLGYACYKLKTNPTTEDFKLSDTYESPISENELLFKQLMTILLDSNDSKGKFLFLNFLEKYHNDLVFVFKKNYPPEIQIKDGRVIKFIFYGVIYSPKSNIAFCVRMYDYKY